MAKEKGGVEEITITKKKRRFKRAIAVDEAIAVVLLKLVDDDNLKGNVGRAIAEITTVE